MKISELRVMLKEVVKEVFHEELKEILLEAVKSPKQPMLESRAFSNPQITESQILGLSPEDKQSLRENYSSLIEGPSRSPIAQRQSGYSPGRYVNTASENSELPEGEVSLDQISQFIIPNNQ